MKLARHYTRYVTAGSAAKTDWTPSLIENAFVWKSFPISLKEGGRTVLEGEVEAPQGWSSQAVTILAHKYLRKAGVPSATTPTVSTDYKGEVPRWLCPRAPSLGAKIGGETSTRQIFRRLAGHWTYAAFKTGYFDDPDNPRPQALPAYQHDDGTTTIDRSALDSYLQAREQTAQVFYDEIFHALASQMAAPNSPQWFNTGIWWAYGIKGSENEGTSGYIATHIGAKATKAPNTYEWPQTSACFILGLRDSLLGEGGILDTVTREARIFKFGSGSGVNYSALRGKGAPLTNGGTSSGLMSFLRLFDSNAGTIKSGGTTRRAARMAIVDVDHPEAGDFADWKRREELKVQSIRLGANVLRERAGTTEADAQLLIGYESAHFEGEAYNTVSGQNANNSLRASDAFMQAISSQAALSGPTGKEDQPKFAHYTKLWDTATKAAWACGDPGFQFHDTINRWHTIPQAGIQRATNPCSEYSFIDDSSCNLASLNLIKFWVDGHELPEESSRDGDFVPGASYFDVEGFTYTAKVWTTVLDVSVGMSSFPDPRVAENSVNYRAVGLGYANLGGLMMLVGVPYDSEEARTYAGLVTAILHGSAWEQSAALAGEPQLGPFHNYADHREDVDRVLGLHRDAAHKLAEGGVAQVIGSAGAGHPFAGCLEWVRQHWINTNSDANWCLGTGRSARIRNAQLTLLAPTGTIGLVMGCDATGIEPVYMLTSFKQLAGGGSLTQEVGLIGQALVALGYQESEVEEITGYIREHGKLGLAAPHIQRAHMKVFDCANDISVGGHIGMMAAVQPFLSGAISKTVNMPNTATVADVANCYVMAWKLGLKAIAIYRDGCKMSQPLSAVAPAAIATHQPRAQDVSLAAGPRKSAPSATAATAALPLPAALSNPAKTTVMGTPPKGVVTPRYKLPSRRSGWTQKVTIAGYSVYLRTGEFSDGRLGEIFLTISRDGSTINHMSSALAITMSLGLQHGVPLQEYVEAFTDSRAEPSGIVQGSDKVRMCSSVMDYVVRELGAHYLHLETSIPIVVQSPEPASMVPQLTVEAPTLNVSSAPQLMRIPDAPSYTTGESTEVASMPEPEDELRQAAGMRTLSQPKYNGQSCRSCGSFTLRRSGTCHVCDTCGETSGCS